MNAGEPQNHKRLGQRALYFHSAFKLYGFYLSIGVDE